MNATRNGGPLSRSSILQLERPAWDRGDCCREATESRPHLQRSDLKTTDREKGVVGGVFFRDELELSDSFPTQNGFRFRRLSVGADLTSSTAATRRCVSGGRFDSVHYYRSPPEALTPIAHDCSAR
uniref:Uncharacterized protein n=1 Tax=Plectus sambesii TaxID=2011161 RepID=A0A914VHN7_9BILA